MDNNKWITKKELLALTHISYGALYRWRRKGLIPDAWFVHKSTFTGQETFFPREKILERIAFIQENKESMSLDEIARRLNPSPTALKYDTDILIRSAFTNEANLESYLHLCGRTAPLQYTDLLGLFLWQHLQHTQALSVQVAWDAVQTIVENQHLLQDETSILLILCGAQEHFSVLCAENSLPAFNSHLRYVAQIPTASWRTAFNAALNALAQN